MMAHRPVAVVALALLVAAGLAGCVGDAPSGGATSDGGGPEADGTSPERSSVPAGPFDQSGSGCSELVVWVTIPAENARQVVPEGYEIVADETGEAAAWAALKRCETNTLAGDDVGEVATANAGVLVEAPDGSDGLHFYQPWWITDDPDLHARLEAQGWDASLEPDLALQADITAGAAGSVEATTPWSRGGYGMVADVHLGPNPQEYVVTTWHEGSDGTVRMAEVLTLSEHSYGPATVATEEGSPARDLFGPEQAGEGLYFLFEGEWTVGSP